MAVAMQRVTGLPTLRAKPVAPVRPVRAVRQVAVCSLKNDVESRISQLAVPVATIVAAGMIASAVVAPEALAARSGGRAGGSNFSARRAAPRAAPSPSVSYHSTTIVAPSVLAPAPVYGGYGYGFGGVRIMPTFVMPFPFFGGILQFMFLALMMGLVFNVVRGFMGSSKRAAKNDDWDKL